MRSLRVVLLATAMVAAACGGGGSTGGGGDEARTGDEAYVVGFSTDLSGPLAAEGLASLAGARAYFEKLNAEGGVDGRPVRLEVRDDRGDVQQGQADVRDLADMGVSVILGHVSTTTWSSTGPLAEELEVPQIALAVLDGLAYPPQPFLYRNLLSSKQAAPAMLQFALDQASTDDLDIALVRLDSAGGAQWADEATENAEALGLEIVADERIPPASSDVTPQAAAVAASEPDWVLGYVIDTHIPLLVESLRNRGYTEPFINFVGGSESVLAELNDPDFYIVRDAVPPQHEAAVEMIEAGEAAGVADDMAHDYGVNGYVLAMHTAEALSECGYPCSGADFNEALLNLGEIDTGGLTGPGWSVDEDDHVMPSTVSIWHTAEGEETRSMVGEWFEPEIKD